MKKIYLLLLLLASCNYLASAQAPAYQKIFGGLHNEEGFDIISTTDGGYAMVGTTGSYGAGDLDVLLIKLDSFAGIQWSQVYGGVGSDQALSLVQTNDHGFAICGKTSSYGHGDFDFLLIKADSAGHQLWTKAFGGPLGERALNLRETKDHGFILAGATLSYGQGDWDMLFIKTDSIGDTLWTKIIGGPDYDQGTDAEQTSDGGYVFLGRADSWGSGIQDVFIARANANGDTLWTRVYGGTNWDEGMKIKQTVDGGYIVTGASTSFTNGNYDVYLNKIDTSGQITWSKFYGGINNDATYDVLELSDGYIITGETESFGVNHHPRLGNNHVAESNPGNHILGTDYANVFVIRTNSIGDTTWTRTYGGSAKDEANSIIQTRDKGFMIAAFSTSFGDSSEFYLIKTDSTGYADCYTGSANPVVSTPPTVIMNTTAHIISGIAITNVPNGSPLSPSVLHTDPCAIIHSIPGVQKTAVNILIYPNPGRSVITLEIPVEYGSAEISIYDMVGRFIKKYPVNQLKQLQFSVADFSPGIYTVKILLGNNTDAVSSVVKLIVE